VSSRKGITLGELAKKINAKLNGDPNKEVNGISTLAEAVTNEISFLSRKQYIEDLKKTKASAVIIGEEHKQLARCDTLIGKDAYLLYAKATQIFKEINQERQQQGISKLADISSSARISSDATINSFCKISDNVEIGDHVVVGSGVVIGESTRIGNRSIIRANVSIYHSVTIGDDCIIHAGSVIGSDGLGFARNGEDWEKIEHLGEVILGNNVEVGSNCSIDRGSVGNTFLDDQVKLDNNVHLAHNVHLGRSTVIAANTAIAGSTTLGKNCTVSGACGIIDNLKITDSVHITAGSLVTKSITKPGTYTSGTPLIEHSLWKRNAVVFKKLKDLIKK
tara:strand:- start:62 stop:1066 length:1005 start_codon:yes stop_codon:yes gene_type:complete